MVMELRDDSKSTFAEAIGLTTYSNSKAGVLSYVAIFENLWKQSELYEQLMKAHEQLKIHDKMQKEFINVAAHELRTPIQPIISLSEVVLNNAKDIEQAELLEVINRNAKRLHRLTEDILDVTKIESQSLNLNKERFDVNDLIYDIVQDYRHQLEKEGKYKVKLLYNNHTKNYFEANHSSVVMEADKGRIAQVISNLLNNAIKFTKEGSISINVMKKINEDGKDSNRKEGQVIVSIKDTGTGIDSEIMPRLFTKFATRSETSGSTGLGLFICKGIIEAHDGRMWAQNNTNGKGATFSFSLPIGNK
jgi:signal transduction histidine kinase